MIEIDGGFGEGGGQILRTGLTLAALTGKSALFKRIRARRLKPGLMRQHAACARAIAEITGGSLEGCELKSQEMSFQPGKIRAGDYRFVVGSAGSAVLIAQAVLPCLLCADGASTVVIEGGTHVSKAPIYDFFERVYLPCLRRMGADVVSGLNRVGFNPAGGGSIFLKVNPIERWKRLEIMEAGALRKARLVALSNGVDPRVGEDELRICRAAMASECDFSLENRFASSPGPGNVLFAELEFEGIAELFSCCGSWDVSRKEVAGCVAKRTNRHLELGIPVGIFLADQLLTPMAVGAGGKFLTAPPSRHAKTNAAVVEAFLDVEIRFENRRNGQYLIEVMK